MKPAQSNTCKDENTGKAENEKFFFAEDNVFRWSGEWSEEAKSEDWDFIAKN